MLNDTTRPNWLFRGLIIISLLVHMAVIMHMAKIYHPRTLSYLELTMRSVAKPFAREIPRPRTRPPVKAYPEKVHRVDTQPLMVPADPLPEMVREESVSDLSRESMSVPHPPVVKDMNISEWNPAKPVAKPVPPTSEVQPEITEEDYRNIVDRKIRASVQYPNQAKKRNLQGRVTIAVTIDADGEISGLKITQSSGHRILDRSVLKAVKESAPFSSPPDGPVTVIVPIQFRLI